MSKFSTKDSGELGLMMDGCREPHSQSKVRLLLLLRLLLLRIYQGDVVKGPQVSITSITGKTMQLKVTQTNIESGVRQSGLFHNVFL